MDIGVIRICSFKKHSKSRNILTKINCTERTKNYFCIEKISTCFTIYITYFNSSTLHTFLNRANGCDLTDENNVY